MLYFPRQDRRKLDFFMPLKQARANARLRCWRSLPAITAWLAGAAIALGLLAACASRPETGSLIQVDQPAAGATSHSMLVATTRQRDARPGTYFNGERAAKLDFASIDISVPPSHQPGEIELPASAPGNPAKDFVVRSAAYLDGDSQFTASLNARLARQPAGKRKVLLFIHGYNTLFAEGVYRFAQIDHDAQSPAVPVLFTWASRGNVTEYVYDNNSATSARDDLEHTLRLIFASNADQVDILTHSMGNWVTVEALRQMKISGNLPYAAKFGTLVLAAPDIDIDVFKSQMRRFGKPAKPFFVVLSRDDKALAASAFFAGGKARLGADTDTAELTALGAVVIDLTDVKANDSSNHDKFAQLAQIAPQLRGVLEGGISAGSASPEQKGGTTRLGALVDVPLTILGAPVRIITGR